MNQKQLWEQLAHKNSRYYINSDKGKGITEEEFLKSGWDDFMAHVWKDNTLTGSFRFKDSVIVDIGCGTGRILRFMADYFKKVIGVDISSEMIKQAKERMQTCSNYELYETDGETIPLSGDSVDIVFSYLVFQHMKTREMVEKNFFEAYRVLKKDGVFKVRLRTDEIQNMENWWAGVNYTEPQIKELSIRCGFTVIKLEYVKDYGVWVWLRK